MEHLPIAFKGKKYELPSDPHYAPSRKLSIDKIDDKYNWFGSMLREKYLDEISK